MANEDIQITGMAEMSKFLQTLAAKVERNLLRGGLRAGASVIAKRAKELCPVSEPNAENKKKYKLYAGALRDTIRVTTAIKNGKVTAIVKAGGKAKRGTMVYYAVMVESGTVAHLIKPTKSRKLLVNGSLREVVHHPGAAAKPFMRPALDEKADAAVAAMGEYMAQRIEKEKLR